MGDLIIGIDLGTTNSVVAIADGGHARVLSDADGQQLIPSVVSFLPDGEVRVGEVARERRLLDAENTIYSVKRLIGRPFDSEEVGRAHERVAFRMVNNGRGGVSVLVRADLYALVEISGFVLQECRRVAERALGTTCDRAVITVPANFNELQRSATKVAADIAGIDVVRILNEPTAAAIAYGYGSKNAAEKIVIYDMGGGTFDVTVLEMDGDVFEVLATAGDTFLGGDDLDTILAEEMADAFLQEHRWDPRTDRQAFERIRAAAEWLKCTLSDKESAEVTVPELTYGAGGKALGLHYGMSRMDLEDLALPLINRSLGVCDEALRQAGITAKNVDTVILVGGSTRIPLLRQMVEEFFESPVRMQVDPDTIVALGAAMQGYLLSGVRIPVKAIGAMPPATPDQARKARERKRSAREARPDQPAFAPERSEGEDEFDVTVDVPEPPIPGRPPRVPDLPTGGSHAPAQPLVSVHGAGPAAGEVYVPPSEPPPAANLPIAFVPPAPAVRLSSRDLRRPPSEIPVADIELVSVPQAQTEASRSLMPMETRTAPVLMDVTPHTLGIEVAGGFSEPIIRAGMPVPCQQRSVFSTAKDGQAEVRVRVCQGSSRKFAENTLLGEAILEGLPPAARGKVKVEVTFVLDANGTLSITAADAGTHKEQSIQIRLLGGHSEDEIDGMRARQEAFHRGQEEDE